MSRWSLYILALLSVCAGVAAAQEWPKCAVRSGALGGPAIVVNGAPYAPLFFIANNQFNKDDVLERELRQAAQAGVMLFGFELRLDWQGAAAAAAATIDRFCSAHPDGFFLVRIWLGPNPEWIARHPDECITKRPLGSEHPEAPQPLNLASLASEPWRKEAAELLRKRLDEILHGPHAGHFLGVTLEYLQTAEWFYPDTNDFMDYSPANLNGFRAWLKKQYKRDKALQAAWGNAGVMIADAPLPTPEQREAAQWGPFRDPALQRPAMDLERYQSALTADTIAYFARVVKDATARRSLVGVYYGYTMELNNNGPRALAHSGHLALGRLLDCRDVDLLHAPFSYFERGLGQPGHLHAPVDSIALHGKLAICEEDTYTHLVQKPPENLIAPGWPDATHTPEETLAVTLRNFGNALEHRCGMWWFDLLADGRWSESLVWQAAPTLRRIAAELRAEPPFRPEVACVLDENAPLLMRDTTYPILLHALSWWRSELDRLGTPVGYYLQSDLARIPDSVKVVILADAFQLGPEDRRAIHDRLRRGATVIWTYAPDLVGPDGPDVDRIGRATGIQVDAKFDDTPMTVVSEMTKDVIEIDSTSWRPRFVVTATDADVVARYQATGEISAAAKPFGKGVSLYTATPRLSTPLLREVCRRAEVHLYCDAPGMIGVAGHYLFVHTSDVGPRAFRWPAECQSVERVFPGNAKAMVLKSGGVWADKLPARATVVYRCE